MSSRFKHLYKRKSQQREENADMPGRGRGAVRGTHGVDCNQSVSRAVTSDSATPWTVAHQAPLSIGFSRQEYWSG